MGFRQSPFPMIEGTTGHKEELASPAKVDISKISRTTESISKKKKLPTFRKGDISVSQYDKEGNKRYNLVDAEGSSADYKNRKDQQTQTRAAKRSERMAPKSSPAKGYGAKAAAHQSGVAGQEFSKKLQKTDTSGKYFKSAGVEGKYPGAPQ